MDQLLKTTGPSLSESEKKQSEKKRRNPASWKLAAGALFCCALWGLAPPLIKMGYEGFSIVSLGSILLFAGIRFFAAGLMVLLFYWIKQKGMHEKQTGKPDPKAESSTQKAGFHAASSSLLPFLKAVIILAFFQTFGQYMFYYFGAANASGIMVSVLSGTGALFSLLLACWLFHMESMTLLKMTGVLSALAGVVVMNLSNGSFSFSWQGEGLVLISQIFNAFSTIYIRRFGNQFDSVLLSGSQFVLGGAAMIVCALLMGGTLQFSWQGLLILFALALISAAAYSLWSILLHFWPVSQVGIYSCTIPLFGVLFSCLLLHEVPGWNVFAALALIVIGILCINRVGKPSASKEKG